MRRPSEVHHVMMSTTHKPPDLRAWYVAVCPSPGPDGAWRVVATESVAHAGDAFVLCAAVGRDFVRVVPARTRTRPSAGLWAL